LLEAFAQVEVVDRYERDNSSTLMLNGFGTAFFSSYDAKIACESPLSHPRSVRRQFLVMRGTQYTVNCAHCGAAL
jgi:hypothetical protein